MLRHQIIESLTASLPEKAADAALVLWEQLANEIVAIIGVGGFNSGRSLNHRVIAEGVETLEQHAFLLSKQCDEGQGYYYGGPMEADALANLLQTGYSSPD